MIDRKLMLGALAAATALTTVATPAAAQHVDRIVAFGDSVADDGNLWQFGVPKPTPDIYPYGRFSNGPNYIDYLGLSLDVPIDNFAIGGAKTDNSNTVVGPALGFVTQYNGFLTGGGGPAFPTVSGQFTDGDLLAISIGGNDARQYQTGDVSFGIPAGTLGGAPAAAIIAAANAKVGLDALVAAGAPTISFFALNTADLPEVTGNTSAQAIRSAYADAFYGALQPTLAGYAANGVMVHYLDGAEVFARIIADPAAYGLASAGACPATSTAAATACIYDPAVGQSYLFYLDRIHGTTAGARILADYVLVQLDGPLLIQGTSDMALDTAHQWGNTLTSRLDLGAPRDGDMPEGMRFYVVGDSFQRKVNISRTNDPFRTSTKGVTLGADYGFGSGVIGAAINYSKPHLNFGTDAAETNSSTWQIGAYGGFGVAGGFVQAYAGYGSDDHDLKRRGVIDSMSADADGSHTVAGIKAGYLMPMWDIRVGPVAALDYARAKVDGYTEDGDAALTLDVDSVSYSALRGSLGLEVRGDVGDAGFSFRPFAAATVEKDFTGDSRTFHFAQTSAPTIVNSWEVGSSKKAYGRFSTGASAGILDNIALDVKLSTTAGKPMGNETTGHLGVRFGF